MISSVGLQRNDLKIIVSVLQQYSEITEAYLFGSRAKWNYRTGSDVDIALKGERLNAEIVSEISYQLNEETPLPYKFDLLNYNSTSSNELKQHIDRVGICFYPEKNQE